MAMTKKEQQAMEDLKTRLALRYTGPAPKRDVLPPTGNGKPLTGFLFNEHSRRVWPLEVNSYDLLGAYSTRRLALQAMRSTVEEECAKQLRAIDLMIEKEEAKP